MSWRWADRERGYCGAFGIPQGFHHVVTHETTESLPVIVPTPASPKRKSDFGLIVATMIGVAITVYVFKQIVP